MKFYKHSWPCPLCHKYNNNEQIECNCQSKEAAIEFELQYNEKGAGWVKENADHSKCCASTGICEATTFGRGECDHHGYWQFPCYYCARKFEIDHPEFGECWPYSDETLKQAEQTILTENGH